MNHYFKFDSSSKTMKLTALTRYEMEQLVHDDDERAAIIFA